MKKEKSILVIKNECKGELKYEVKVTTIKRGVWLNEKNNGKVKVVLISSDGELTTLAECVSDKDNSSDTTSLSLPQGEYRIKIIAGENTKFDISLSITDGSFHELGL